MIRGLYTSGLGMTVQMQNLDVIANNIANADTTGFKRDVAVTQSFSSELLKRLHDPAGIVKTHDTAVGNVNLGVFVNDVYTDFTQGQLTQTGGTFDLAIDGGGFFGVNATDAQGNAAVKFTRDGSFTLNADRYLVTTEGNYVAGRNGNIQVPDGTCDIRENGDIYVNGQYVDTIMTVNVDNQDSLRKTGDNLYASTGGTTLSAFTGSVQQGYLEGANINVIKEMVNMIAANRAYEANSKMVTYADQSLSHAANDIGRKP